MDGNKLQAVLSNPELMAKIAALVNGEPPKAETPKAEPQDTVGAYAPSRASVPNVTPQADRGIALLYALRPFLKEERRRKLDAATGAISAASIFRNAKKL